MEHLGVDGGGVGLMDTGGSGDNGHDDIGVIYSFVPSVVKTTYAVP